MSKQVLIALVIIVVLAAGGIYMATRNNNNASVPSNETLTPIESSSSVPTASDMGQSSPSGATQGNTKEFTVTSSGLKFSPTTLTVGKGDTVKITFKNGGGTHNLTVDGYNTATKTISSGQEDIVTFTADKTGSFEFYCSVDGHRQAGMKGTLVVQ